MQILVRFLAVPLVLLSMVLLPVIGKAIIGPVSQAAGLLKAPTRFQLSDFVWLLVIIQAALAAVVRFVGVETRGAFEAILLYLLFASTALWCGAISFLSRAGVTDPYRRAAFILFILPGTLILMIGIPSSVLMVLFTVAEEVMRYGGYYSTTYPLWQVATAAFVAFVVVPALIIGMRKASLWVVNDPAAKESIANLEHPLAPSSADEIAVPSPLATQRPDLSGRES